MQKTKLLVVDDEDSQRQMLAGYLEKNGFTIKQAASGEEALKEYATFFSPVAVVDMKMPGMGGIELIGRLKQTNPFIQIIVLTAFGSVDTAVSAMKQGAFHYQTKPVELKELLLNLQKASEQYRLVMEHQVLSDAVNERFGSGEIIGNSKAVEDVLELINLSAPGDTTILVTGPSGTGKELAARAIHSLSPRKNNSFVAVNCAAIPENLLESELFGHEKGAFTGADKRKLGRFELAEQGTIFLDEIGDMPPAMQAKMLRVIEYKEIERLGSEKTVPLDVRIITATNKDLTKMVEEGTFREDLYYRINVVTISMPPLKDRAGDVLLLADKFLKRYSKKLGKKISGFTPDAASAMTAYHWPGNVRELQNVIERGVVLTRSDLISIKELPGLGQTDEGTGQFEKMSDVEKFHIKKILDRMGGNIGKSADILGIHRNTLRAKIKEYGLSE
ncbi:MAG: sigma-54-dependent Fis family transcriptional regulator [candidate division Zixibacteria bacterium]|nr:sigma-54-dependent Fis family transcriptional regulator [candidate division Zixibacteria bacterium]